MPLAFSFAARSDVGMVRANNEDSGYAGPHLLAMADGMGGHAGGDVASSTVIGELVDLDGEALSGAEATDALLARITAANTELGEMMREEPELVGMGTTLIALLRARDKLVLAHIGDSRAFLVRGGEVTQITKDHSFVQSLVDEGRLTPQQAQTHPQRSLVTRVLTGSADDEPDVTVRQAQRGDRYLIASDGLTDYVARDTIDELLLQQGDPAECADRLVELALRAGAPDNVTVVIGDIVDLSTQTPSDHPQVVGAAAERRGGTRPIPVTPAEKAAALTQEATGARDEGIMLAEEGPRSRTSRLVRAVGATLVALLVIAGGSYAAYAWTQQQYFVGVEAGKVAVFRGVRSDIGPISLHEPVKVSTVSVTDLPAIYQQELEAGITRDGQQQAEAFVALLGVQAQACRWSRLLGRACTTVSPTWTTPSPTLRPSPTPTRATATPTRKASAPVTPTRPRSVTPSPSRPR